MFGYRPLSEREVSNAQDLFMPYAATWLRHRPWGLLVRQSSPNPEVVVVASEQVDAIPHENEQQLVDYLASLFGESARVYGVRFLTEERQIVEA